MSSTFLLSFRTESRASVRNAIVHARKSRRAFSAPCRLANPMVRCSRLPGSSLRVRGLEPRTCEGLLTTGRRFSHGFETIA